MKKGLEDRLGQLKIGDPDLELRGKVLAAAAEGLDEAPRRISWRDWLAAWRMEALLSGAIAATVLILLLLNPSPTGHLVPMALVDQNEVDSIVEELQLDKDLEAHFRTRLQLTERKLAAKRRAGHGHRTINIEAF